MNLNKQSISARGYKYFYNTHQLPDNLCPYFWKLVIAWIFIIALLPFHIFASLFNKFNCFSDNIIDTIKFITLAIILGAMVSPILLFWYAFDKGGLLPILISLGGAIDMLVIIGLLVVLKQHLFKSTPKQNSIIKEFIMAKYKKYCPKINWS